MKKRNPTDATLRNIRALQKRVTKLETQIRGMVKILELLIETDPGIEEELKRRAVSKKKSRKRKTRQDR